MAARARHTLVDVDLAGLPWGVEQAGVTSAPPGLSLVHPWVEEPPQPSQNGRARSVPASGAPPPR